MNYAIQNTETKEFFSLLNGGLFTSNVEIISRFETQNAAMFCTEQYIDTEFEKFGMIDTEIVEIN